MQAFDASSQKVEVTSFQIQAILGYKRRPNKKGTREELLTPGRRKSSFKSRRPNPTLFTETTQTGGQGESEKEEEHEEEEEETEVVEEEKNPTFSQQTLLWKK